MIWGVVSSESDMEDRQLFLIAVDDLPELWVKFVKENNVVLDALVELGEDENFSSSEELEAKQMLVSAKALAQRLSSLNISNEPPVRIDESSPDAVGNSEATTRSVDGQSDIFGINRSPHSANLPEISLPRFKGELADRDRFTALVDSRSIISNVEKFYYLLGCLGFDASEVVKDITVSNDTCSCVGSTS